MIQINVSRLLLISNSKFSTFIYRDCCEIQKEKVKERERNNSIQGWRAAHDVPFDQNLIKIKMSVLCNHPFSLINLYLVKGSLIAFFKHVSLFANFSEKNESEYI